MTESKFCEMYSSFYGEEIDKVGQLVKSSFSGAELKEFIEHCLKQANDGFTVGDTLKLPFDEVGILKEKLTLPWGHDHIVEITEGTLNEVGDRLEFKAEDMTLIESDSSWVLCSTNLPKRRTRVLITDGKIVTEAHLNKISGLWEGYTLLGLESLGEVTMWQNLPTIPESMR